GLRKAREELILEDMEDIEKHLAEGEFEETEELYHTSKDGLELENKAGDSDHHNQLQRMRKVYDGYVAAWGRDAVPYNNYQTFSKVFDRKTSWQAKRDLVMAPKKKRR
ncbi:MAG: hypothetical protein ACPGVU_12220, partial [Limisphaerales bacterium]